MTSDSHTALLQKAIDALTAEGFRVIRIDRRAIPDAIAIKNDKITAIEAETRSITSPRVHSYGDYDHTIINTKPYRGWRHNRAEYERALQPRKQGLTYGTIVEVLKREFSRNFSRDIVHRWVKGKSRPLDVKALA